VYLFRQHDTVSRRQDVSTRSTATHCRPPTAPIDTTLGSKERHRTIRYIIVTTYVGRWSDIGCSSRSTGRPFGRCASSTSGRWSGSRRPRTPGVGRNTAGRTPAPRERRRGRHRHYWRPWPTSQSTLSTQNSVR